ncbi:MAG: hypothetical protein ACPGU1_12485 [Myxococcota bacterium]
MMVELEIAGHDVHFVSINIISGLESQEEIIKHCTYPQLQDTDDLRLWSRFDGRKDDFYILDSQGRLRTYLPFSGGEVSTNLGEDEDYQAVKDAILKVIATDGDDPFAISSDDTSDVAGPGDAEIEPEDAGPVPEDIDEGASTDTTELSPDAIIPF